MTVKALGVKQIEKGIAQLPDKELAELMSWLVDNLTPDSVEVVQASSFQAACQVLEADPPEAAIFNVTPCDLPWDELRELCRKQQPPVPCLWCSSVDAESAANGGVDCSGDHFFVKPLSIKELRARLAKLLDIQGNA